MAALDTNVLVRYLVQDDERQLAAASRLIRRCVETNEAMFVPISVSLELEWVLRSNFKFSKTEVIETLSVLLAADELVFESEGAVELALRWYAHGTADYSDCMHAALAALAGHQPLWTFDRSASKVDGARLLT
ncbi:PIN domain-containing protein [Variovorax defluvii]|uniref:Ribonuclease VapC n=1 Tax=Variovorax defluvii TaxID=913761 RepID=A0ABP8HIT7_9BURK